MGKHHEEDEKAKTRKMPYVREPYAVKAARTVLTGGLERRTVRQRAPILPTRPCFGGKQCRIFSGSQRATHYAIIHGARGDTARACDTSTTPPSARAQLIAPLRSCHGRRPRRPPRRCTAQAPARDPGHRGGAHGSRNAPITSQSHRMYCPPASPLFASSPWLLHTGCSLEPMDITLHERNPSRGYRRCQRRTPLVPMG